MKVYMFIKSFFMSRLSNKRQNDTIKYYNLIRI